MRLQLWCTPIKYRYTKVIEFSMFFQALKVFAHEKSFYFKQSKIYLLENSTSVVQLKKYWSPVTCVRHWSRTIWDSDTRLYKRFIAYKIDSPYRCSFCGSLVRVPYWKQKTWVAPLVGLQDWNKKPHLCWTHRENSHVIPDMAWTRSMSLHQLTRSLEDMFSNLIFKKIFLLGGKTLKTNLGATC